MGCWSNFARSMGWPSSFPALPEQDGESWALDTCIWSDVMADACSWSLQFSNRSATDLLTACMHNTGCFSCCFFFDYPYGDSTVAFLVYYCCTCSTWWAVDCCTSPAAERVNTCWPGDCATWCFGDLLLTSASRVEMKISHTAWPWEDTPRWALHARVSESCHGWSVHGFPRSVYNVNYRFM